jgi:hypothetical protein
MMTIDFISDFVKALGAEEAPFLQVLKVKNLHGVVGVLSG